MMLRPDSLTSVMTRLPRLLLSATLTLALTGPTVGATEAPPDWLVVDAEPESGRSGPGTSDDSADELADPWADSTHEMLSSQHSTPARLVDSVGAPPAGRCDHHRSNHCKNDRTDTRIVQMENIHTATPGNWIVELAYLQRDADTRYVANMQKYELETGRAEVRYGVRDGLEVSLGGRALPATLFTAVGQTPFGQVTDIEPIVSMGVKHSGGMSDTDWKYALGANKSLGNSNSRQFELPDDARAADAIYGVLSHPLIDGVDTLFGVQRAWLPSAGAGTDQTMDSLGLGFQVRPHRNWTVSLEAIAEDLPGNGQSGVSLLADRTPGYLNASVRAAIGEVALETALHRLDDPEYSQLDIALSKAF
ncbi:MAG: hypothetical protein HYY25_07755 [Candidatus Wallbacteria bacterium]|nr:hypothetical protein [Candidatus Wallbacteria bacterium]